jgi:hypothetical protein
MREAPTRAASPSLLPTTRLELAANGGTRTTHRAQRSSCPGLEAASTQAPRVSDLPSGSALCLRLSNPIGRPVDDVGTADDVASRNESPSARVA